MKAKKYTNGAYNHTTTDREVNDFYATDPKAMEELLKVENFSPNVWECACGEGHLAKVLESHGYNVKATDLIDRGYGEGNVDFLNCQEPFDGDILSNPPYKFAQEFVEHSLELIPEGRRVGMFLKLNFLESKKRRKFFEKYPPEYIYVSTSRLQCAKNGDFEKYKLAGIPIAYAWFIWSKGFTGDPKLRWFN